jgi:hypothetical protein
VQGIRSRTNKNAPNQSGRFSQPGLTFAIAGQQGRLLTAWAAWQLIEQLGRRKAIALGLFVHDLGGRLAIARAANGWLLTGWLIVTGRAAIARLVFATSLAITTGAIAWAAALGRSACA